MFFSGQKGTPVKFEFDIFVEDIKPWASTEAQSDDMPIPLLLAWRRGRSCSGTTKSVVPSIGDVNGSRIVFNESFILRATLFEKKSGEFSKKSVTFELLEDESAKIVKISRQLAIGELDLSHFGNASGPQSTSIPLAIGLLETHCEGDPTLFIRISSSRRLPSSSSIFSGRSSSSGRSSITEAPLHRTSYFLPESDDSNDEHESIDSFTDDEDSRQSSDDESKNIGTKAIIDRQKLLPSSSTIISSKITQSKPGSPPLGSFYGKTLLNSSLEKTIGKTTRNKSEISKLSEDEMREKLLGLHEPPRKIVGAATKKLEVSQKVVEEGKMSLEKNIDGFRNTSIGKSFEIVKNTSTRKNLEPMKDIPTGKSLDPLEKSTRSTTIDTTTTIVKMDRALEKSALIATTTSKECVEPSVSITTYVAKKASKDDQLSERPISELPFHTSSTPSSSVSSLVLTNNPPQQSNTTTKFEMEKQSLDIDDQNKSVLGDARAKMAMVEKRAIEELRSKVAAAEAKAIAYQDKGKEIASHLQEKMLIREDELRDTAAIEVALYSVTAEHTSSPHKLHTPARRLARLYVYAFKNWSVERRASCARNSIQGLVVVVRASGNDVPRLTYWWSNIVVLRESIMQACRIEPTSNDESTTTSNNNFAERAKWLQHLQKQNSKQGSTSDILGFKSFNNDWKDCNTYVVTLLKVETWIHGRILECVWWQAMAPPMQVGGSDTTSRLHPSALGATFINVRDELNRFAMKVKDGFGELNKFAGDVKEFFTKERQDGNLSQLGDARQGTISIEIWKNAFTDSLKRLCPLQGHEAQCGCLPVLSRQVIAECVDRLDVAMFNGIMRDPGEDSPTDPLADPITDLSVLPIRVGALTFGAGSQLKNAVVTWSTWLATLLNVKDPESTNNEEVSDGLEELQRQRKFNLLKATSELFMLPKDMIDMAIRRDAARKEAEKTSPYFLLLRGASDLLMLPKDMLMDKSIRKEVCPQLKLPLIRRILCNFVPDEFAPEPISPSLVAAINTEVSLERQMMGGDGDIEDISIAPVPICIYIPPSSAFVRLWIGEPPEINEWGKPSSSLLCKGYGSDDELNHFQTPLAWLKESPNTRNSIFYDAIDIAEAQSMDESRVYTSRYQLLKEVWDP